MKQTGASTLRRHWIGAFSPEERTLTAMLQRQAGRNGRAPLVTFGDTTLTYDAACAVAARCAGALHAAGVRAGNRVAIICSNRIEFIELLLGCAWLGAVLVPLNTASRGPQLQHMLSNSGARLLVLETSFADNLALLDPAALAIDTIWTIGASAPVALPATIAPMPHDAAPLPPAPVRPGDMALILYTSGTTGLSKGVCCPHGQYFWWGVNTASLLELHDGDVLSTTLPLFHTNALNTFYQALLIGGHVHYETRFSASGFFDALTRSNATVTFLLGAMVPILLSRTPDAAERNHRARLALAPGVPARFHGDFTARTGIRLLEGWASTETNFAIGAPIDHQQPGCMGPAFDGFDARVVDDQDNPVPDGTAGELIVRADDPFAFATGYFGADDKTVEAWRNLWFHTGDRVIRQPDGYFRFVDRVKDAIRRRGENISSYEVEQVLLSHPAVANAAVFPVRSELAEDEVMAAVILRDGTSLAPAELIAYCEPRLAYFAVPRYLEFMTVLPATENGKVQKFKLRERGVTAETFDRGPVSRSKR